jgi:hypothetical protein
MKRIGLDVPELAHDHHKVGLPTCCLLHADARLRPSPSPGLPDRVGSRGIDDVEQTVGKHSNFVRQRVWPRDYAAQGAGDDAQ